MDFDKNSAIKPLVEGYKKFRKENFEDANTFESLVTHGQKPKVLMIACCDSRVDPAIVTGCKPGDLFVVRNVANLVPPYESDLRHHGTSAAMEFAVLALGVTDIVVFGHQQCGGIKALLQGTGDEKFDFIAPWMNIGKAAKASVLAQYANASPEEQCHQCEKASLVVSLKNLHTFPWIHERMTEKRLFLHAWYFDMANGVVERYRDDQNDFVPLD